MKYVDEYRQAPPVRRWSEALCRLLTRPWTVMEICGGQTHAIVKFGLEGLLPDGLQLIHGPGCPVCVTPVEMIDQAIVLARRSAVIFCSFGDMLRVPGTGGDLLTAKAKGADVRVVHSPLEALQLAVDNPSKEVVFFAVGFETTAPASAMAAYQAQRRGIGNFSMLVAHVLVPPAMRYLLSSPANAIQGFLAAGHVCTVTGYSQYPAISEAYRVPIVVTGFEPLDILQGLYHCVAQLEEGRYTVQNQYRRCVRSEGNVRARELVEAVFTSVDRCWRGIGVIERSGLALRDPYAGYDAVAKFALSGGAPAQDNGCISGLVLQGKRKPRDCPLFGSRCTPENPCGAPMVSSEGACAAYYHYSRSKS